jgi:hypothetical protein
MDIVCIYGMHLKPGMVVYRASFFIGWHEGRNVVLTSVGRASVRGEGWAEEKRFRHHSTALEALGGVVDRGKVLRSLFLRRDGPSPSPFRRSFF